MCSEMQDCLFPNLGIFRNMKPSNVSSYSIPGKKYRLREVDAKTKNKNIIFQKHDPKQQLIFRI